MKWPEVVYELGILVALVYLAVHFYFEATFK